MTGPLGAAPYPYPGLGGSKSGGVSERPTNPGADPDLNGRKVTPLSVASSLSATNWLRPGPAEPARSRRSSSLRSHVRHSQDNLFLNTPSGKRSLCVLVRNPGHWGPSLLPSTSPPDGRTPLDQSMRNSDAVPRNVGTSFGASDPLFTPSPYGTLTPDSPTAVQAGPAGAPPAAAQPPLTGGGIPRPVDPSSTNPDNSVALYLRVSTEDQDLAGQEGELRAEADRRGWSVAAVYAEKASATGKVERKEYERLLADSKRPDRQWSHLLVWSLDRWSREERFSRAVATIEELEAAGVRFHSLHEPILDSAEDGTPNIGRDLLRAILPVIASFESRRRADRVNVAMREIKAGRRKTRSGRPPGRPRLVTPLLAEKANTLRQGGLPWTSIAQRVGLKAETCRRAVFDLRKGAKSSVGG